jgi:hypothetical protein
MIPSTAPSTSNYARDTISCGGLCGSWRFHILEKVHGKWNEAKVAMCIGAS